MPSFVSKIKTWISPGPQEQSDLDASRRLLDDESDEDLGGDGDTAIRPSSRFSRRLSDFDMTSSRTKAGHFLAKCLGIKLDYRNELPEDPDRPGQSIYSVQTGDSFVEEEPTTMEYIREIMPGREELGRYVISLFPFTQWIMHYNLQWLIGDLVAGQLFPRISLNIFLGILWISPKPSIFLTETAGITIGAVVVPQGMAYAKLAELPVQFGLYTSFMGVLIYWFFATSKDITIGVSSVLAATDDRR